MAEKIDNIVLMLSSNPANCAGLEDILKGAGFGMVSAKPGDEGVQLSNELLPSIIIIDHERRNTGMETCRRLRTNQVLKNTPILMLADRDDVDAHAVGLSHGADDFLDKPLDGLQVISRLRSLTRFSPEHYLLADLKRFSWMVEYAREGYLMLDRSGSIHYANERAQNLLNMPEDFFGLPFTNVVERQFVPKPVETWKTWMEDPAPCFLVQPESPTARAVWVVLEALDPPSGVDYQRLVRLRDVTERMSIFQDMRRFHTVVAHKLRTPMSMLMMSLSILKNQMEVLPKEEVKNLLGTAIKGTDRLAEEVRSILTYIDAPLALNLGSPMMLKDLPGMVNSLGAILHLPNLNLELPESLNTTTIAMTPDALEMALHELFENSHKFHPQRDPHIEIVVKQTEADSIHMVITDDGLTLSIEQLQWAWLPYFQGEKDFTGEIPGLGLGFPMVATLVWKAGGSMSLRNRINGPGISVEMKIPLESAVRRMERSARPYGS